MQWVKQGNKSTKESSPCITIRKKQIALNVELMRRSGFKVGDFAEVYVSECGSAVAVKFHHEDADGRFKLTPDGGGLGRVADTGACNAVIASSSLAEHPQLLHVTGTKNAKLFAALGENGMWVANVNPTWKYSLTDRAVTSDDTGVYRYLLEGETVYIGQGKVADRIRSSERAAWAFDDIQYFLCPVQDCVSHEARLLQSFKAEYGKLPFYNKVLGMKK